MDIQKARKIYQLINEHSESFKNINRLYDNLSSSTIDQYNVGEIHLRDMCGDNAKYVFRLNINKEDIKPLLKLYLKYLEYKMTKILNI